MLLPVMSGMLQIFIAKKLPFCYFSIEYYLHIYTMYNEYFLTTMNPQYWRFYTDIIVMYA